MVVEEEETLDRSVIRGILIFYYYLAQTWVYTGATHSLELHIDVFTIPLRATILV